MAVTVIFESAFLRAEDLNLLGCLVLSAGGLFLT
jgi:hypothetical protein